MSQVNNLYIRLISQSINATAIFYFFFKLLHNLSISLRYKGLLVVTVINIIKVLLYKYYYHDYWGDGVLQYIRYKLLFLTRWTQWIA